MRKVIWCCSAAGMLAAGSFFSLAYYACCRPDSVVGRTMQVIAEASIAMQPLSGITSMAMGTSQANVPANETATPPGECIPDDPLPIAVQEKEDVILESCTRGVEPEAAPIIIPEDDPMPREEAAPDMPHSIVLNERNLDTVDMQGQEVPQKGCPTVMPRCQDEDEGPVNAPKRPRPEGGEEKEPSVFKAWMELFAEGKEEKIPAVEQLPPPTEEEPQGEPKCQEDTHLHEHYPGCPRTTCPFTSKDRLQRYYQRVWDLASQLKKKGSEESSEEPSHPAKEPNPSKECPRTKGVDTMEYRKSDAGLDEYGPGPLH